MRSLGLFSNRFQGSLHTAGNNAFFSTGPLYTETLSEKFIHQIKTTGFLMESYKNESFSKLSTRKNHLKEVLANQPNRESEIKDHLHALDMLMNFGISGVLVLGEPSEIAHKIAKRLNEASIHASVIYKNPKNNDRWIDKIKEFRRLGVFCSPGTLKEQLELIRFCKTNGLLFIGSEGTIEIMSDESLMKDIIHNCRIKSSFGSKLSAGTPEAGATVFIGRDGICVLPPYKIDEQNYSLLYHDPKFRSFSLQVERLAFRLARELSDIGCKNSIHFRFAIEKNRELSVCEINPGLPMCFSDVEDFLNGLNLPMFQAWVVAGNSISELLSEELIKRGLTPGSKTIQEKMNTLLTQSPIQNAKSHSKDQKLKILSQISDQNFPEEDSKFFNETIKNRGKRHAGQEAVKTAEECSIPENSIIFEPNSFKHS